MCRTRVVGVVFSDAVIKRESRLNLVLDAVETGN